ncbi:flagellar assembly protein FliW [Viridibacillus arvi]|uniref:flagellar assembly protein FliW n=1 Tax=Viridibacillus arvi TaxID=263475 RepID=UPI0036C03D44
MQIHTKFLGPVEIIKEQIIIFEKGIPGFEKTTKYVLLPIQQDSPFATLQSIEEQEVGFIVTIPFAFKKDYVFDLAVEDTAALKVTSDKDILTYSIVTLKDPFETSTINLLAPIIINTTKKLGKQIVLQDGESYPLRFQLNAVEGSAK